MGTNGWLYCVTSQELLINSTYKCGFTTKGKTLSEAIDGLKHRYGTSYPDVNIKHVVIVSTPKTAENELFEELKEIKLKKEFFKTDDVNIIINKMNQIAEKYQVSKETKKGLTSSTSLRYIRYTHRS